MILYIFIKINIQAVTQYKNPRQLSTLPNSDSSMQPDNDRNQLSTSPQQAQISSHDPNSVTTQINPKIKPYQQSPISSVSKTKEISIQGTKFVLTPQQIKLMKLFDVTQAVYQNETTEVDIFSPELFTEMRELLKLADYDFPDYPAINTSVLSDVISFKMAKYLENKSPKELNLLYRISQFFYCDGLKKYIVAAVACRIYIKQSLESYRAKKVDLNIIKDLDEKRIRELQNLTPYIN